MFLQNQYLAMKICEIFNVSVRNKINDKKNIIKNAEFPTTNTIYLKDIVIEADTKNKKVSKYSDIDENYISNKENIEKNEVIIINNNIENDKKDSKRIYKEDLKNLLNNKNKTAESTTSNSNHSIANMNPNKTSETISTSNSLCSNDNSTNSDKTEKIHERNNSDYSLSSENTVFSNKKRNSVFIRKNKSRFKFAREITEENKEENSNINHDFLCDLISFKTSTYFFLQNVETDEYIYTKYKLNIVELQKIIDLNRGDNLKN